jgi:hypothetical protein
MLGNATLQGGMIPTVSVTGTPLAKLRSAAIWSCSTEEVPKMSDSTLPADSYASASSELLVLEAERDELTKQMKAAQSEWAETVRTEGQMVAADRSKLHDIRNRLQIVLSKISRLYRQIGKTEPW